MASEQVRNTAIQMFIEAQEEFIQAVIARDQDVGPGAAFFTPSYDDARAKLAEATLGLINVKAREVYVKEHTDATDTHRTETDTSRDAGDCGEGKRGTVLPYARRSEPGQVAWKTRLDPTPIEHGPMGAVATGERLPDGNADDAERN